MNERCHRLIKQGLPLVTFEPRAVFTRVFWWLYLDTSNLSLSNGTLGGAMQVAFKVSGRSQIQ